jgi:hypothetical protein
MVCRSSFDPRCSLSARFVLRSSASLAFGLAWIARDGRASRKFFRASRWAGFSGPRSVLLGPAAGDLARSTARDHDGGRNCHRPHERQTTVQASTDFLIFRGSLALSSFLCTDALLEEIGRGPSIHRSSVFRRSYRGRPRWSVGCRSARALRRDFVISVSSRRHSGPRSNRRGSRASSANTAPGRLERRVKRNDTACTRYRLP